MATHTLNSSHQSESCNGFVSHLPWITDTLTFLRRSRPVRLPDVTGAVCLVSAASWQRYWTCTRTWATVPSSTPSTSSSPAGSICTCMPASEGFPSQRSPEWVSLPQLHTLKDSYYIHSQAHYFFIWVYYLERQFPGKTQSTLIWSTAFIFLMLLYFIIHITAFMCWSFHVTQLYI